jgi:hypothetical protein
MNLSLVSREQRKTPGLYRGGLTALRRARERKPTVFFIGPSWSSSLTTGVGSDARGFEVFDTTRPIPFPAETFVAKDLPYHFS